MEGAAGSSKNDETPIEEKATEKVDERKLEESPNPKRGRPRKKQNPPPPPKESKRVSERTVRLPAKLRDPSVLTKY